MVFSLDWYLNCYEHGQSPFARLVLFFKLFLFWAATVHNIGYYTLSTKFNAIILTDIATGNRFILDSTRIMVTALNPEGKHLWKTDAWKNNHLEVYRVERPVISHFAFGKDDSAKKKEVIWLTYNNTQFGFLDKRRPVHSPGWIRTKSLSHRGCAAIGFSIPRPIK